MRSKYGIALALLACVVAAPDARAQGSRKDDVVFNSRGTPLGGASVRVCAAGATGTPCAPLALIYSDVGLTQALANPLSTDGLGNYFFYAAPGRYVIEISGPGIATRTLRDVILPSDPSSPTFTSITTTSGISAFSLSLSGNLTVNGSASATLGLTAPGIALNNQATPPAAPSAGQVALYSKSSDKRLYYKDDTGAEIGPLNAGGGGGASLSADNKWVASQRFRGPVPWRDITAYGATSSTQGPTTGTIAAGSATLALAAALDFANGQGIAVVGAGPASTLTPPVNVTAVAHNGAGPRAYTYQVVAVDSLYGMSAASAAVTVPNGVNALSKDSYNFIHWNAVTGAVAYLIYSDGGTGGALTCVGTAFGHGYVDTGMNLPCGPAAPAAPPVAATPQTLSTTIVSGGGAATLVLAAAASTAATGQNVYHDESSFLNAALADAKNDAALGQHGIVYVPAGTYAFTSLAFPAGSGAGSGVTTMRLQGALRPTILPLIVNQNLMSFEGTGASGSHSTGAGWAATPWISPGNLSQMPALLVAEGITAGLKVQGLFGVSLRGDGIVIAGDISGDIVLQDIDLSQDPTLGNGSCLRVDTNTIFLWAHNFACQGTTLATGMPGIYANAVSNATAPTSQAWWFENVVLDQHGIKLDVPMGTGGGSDQHFRFSNVSTENFHDPALLTIDSGSSAADGAVVHDILLDNVNFADAVNPTRALVDILGGGVTVDGIRAEQTSGISTGVIFNHGDLRLSKDTQQPVPGLSMYYGIGGPVAPGSIGVDYGYREFAKSQTTIAQPLFLPQQANGQNDTVIAVVAPRAALTSVTPAAGGTLAAGTYFYRVTLIADNGGESTASRELSCTVDGTTTATCALTFQPAGGTAFDGWVGFRVYRGTASAAETGYFNAGTCLGNSGAACSATAFGYNDTGAVALTAAAIPASNGAYDSRIAADNGQNSYLLAGRNGNQGRKLGIGTAQPQEKLDVWGNLLARGSVKIGATSAGANPGILTSANTAARTYTFPDATGNVPALPTPATTETGAGAIVRASALPLSGTTTSIGGAALAAGACASGTVTLTGATTSMAAVASPNTYPGNGAWWSAQITAANTVTVRVCAAVALTPVASTYNVRVIQ